MDLKNTAPGSLPHSGTNNSLKSGSESTVTATLNLCNTLEQWRDGRLAQGGSPFSKIPDELCEEILVYVGVAPDPVQVKKNSSGDPPVFGWTKDLEHAVELFSPCNDPKAAIWSLSLVCARWRRIVRGCPQLYTNIKVEGIRHRKKQVWEAKKRITLVCLKLSGKLSLNLHFVASRKYWSTSPNSNDLDQEHLKKFFDSAPRWKSLIFMVQFLNWFEQPNGQEDIVHLAYPLTLPASLPYLSSIRIGGQRHHSQPLSISATWMHGPICSQQSNPNGPKSRTLPPPSASKVAENAGSPFCLK
ncbi:hypothetical protein FA15DRAFT_406598 [Coprinopsis marcescibilis]|uniref:Uncharacterized protein n=1 Tax=Coprinopsis marcescibilis TaxID=230819 RepID=A0A5C3KWD0_COPMA|nr:hypothetical protein FA15DRAFT_406598 [Coprinopsis marcescibilis]